MSDFDRPLSEQGMRDAARAGEKLATLGIKVDVLICSTAVRTKTTAEILATKLSVKDMVREPSLYNTGPEEYLEAVQSLGDSADVLVLVGHNPTVSEFPAATGEYLTPASAVIWLWEGENWMSFTPEKARLAEIITA